MPSPSLSDNEKLEAWGVLLKHATERFDTRRSFEWKVSLGLWAALLGVAQFMKEANGTILPAWPFIAISLVYGLIWLPGLWQANDNDKTLAAYYREQIEISLGVVHKNRQDEFPGKNADICHRVKAFTDWSIQFQFAATCGLSMFVWVFSNHCAI